MSDRYIVVGFILLVVLMTTAIPSLLSIEAPKVKINNISYQSEAKPGASVTITVQVINNGNADGTGILWIQDTSTKEFFYKSEFFISLGETKYIKCTNKVMNTEGYQKFLITSGHKLGGIIVPDDGRFITIHVTNPSPPPPDVVCWRCNNGVAEYRVFPHGTVCGSGQASNYPYSSEPNCYTPPPPPSTFTVTINVLDDDTNKPIAGATVEINAVINKITNDDGVAVFTDIEGGSYTISVFADGYKSSSMTVNIDGNVVYTMYLSKERVIPGFEVVTVFGAITILLVLWKKKYTK